MQIKGECLVKYLYHACDENFLWYTVDDQISPLLYSYQYQVKTIVDETSPGDR